MSVVALELFKKHTRTDDYDADDVLLTHYLETAEEEVIRSTGRSFDELCVMNGGTFPRGLVQAIMVLAAHWHNQRESVSSVQMHSVPDSLQALVKPWRKLSVLCKPEE